MEPESMKAKDCLPGQEITIRAVVVEQRNGQTLCWAPGVGNSGMWSIVNSVNVETIGDELTPLQTSALRALAERAGIDV